MDDCLSFLLSLSSVDAEDDLKIRDSTISQICGVQKTEDIASSGFCKLYDGHPLLNSQGISDIDQTVSHPFNSFRRNMFQEQQCA